VIRRLATCLTAIGTIGVALGSCARADIPNADSAAAVEPIVADVATPDSASVTEATRALASYLEASREGSPTRDSLLYLTACPEGVDYVPGPMLAAYEVLPATTRADTVVGRAVVTTVADQEIDRQHPGYFVARIRVRSDTLEWDVLRAEAGDWVVCNGIRFGLDAPDSLTAWRPNGASAATARALADSIGARR
jgi:hypothetical protein